MTKQISHQHSSNDWTPDLADINSPNWTKGIQIIRERFESRYFNPINELMNSKDSKIKYSCGFLVMSVDCLLIETLNQFFLGLYSSEEMYNRDNADSLYRYNKQAFRDFFLHSSFFPDFKNEIVSNTFYKQIRCGLLHQAQSKADSLINVKESQMVKLADVDNPENGLIINRELFHKALVKEFNKYLQDLENPTSENIFGENLRERCNRKMADLCA